MSRRLRVMVAATEFPGHAFPEFALAGELKKRGHDVVLHTSSRWAPAVDRVGAELMAIEDVGGVAHHGVFGDDLVRAARALVPRLEEFEPDVVVSDMATAAPPLAAELAGVPSASVVALVYPVEAPGLPPYPWGRRPPRTALGAAAWRALTGALRPLRPRSRRLRAVAAELDAVRTQLELPPRRRDAAITSYGALSDELTIVATFPQLEHPRSWPAHVHVTGPLLFDPPAPTVEPSPGDTPLVVVVGSTAQDPEATLVSATLAALAEEPVRVLASTGGTQALASTQAPDNATVTDWISPGEALPGASAVVSRGGHGTLTRALSAGVPVLACPGSGDMPENAARLCWAGAGLALRPRRQGPDAIRAGVRRLISEPGFRARARELREWHLRNDGAERASGLIEALAVEHR
jgi:UDP:flavonoid glycosyltransferase YjiC (YdhE family)